MLLEGQEWPGGWEGGKDCAHDMCPLGMRLRPPTHFIRVYCTVSSHNYSWHVLTWCRFGINDLEAKSLCIQIQLVLAVKTPHDSDEWVMLVRVRQRLCVWPHTIALQSWPFSHLVLFQPMPHLPLSVPLDLSNVAVPTLSLFQYQHFILILWTLWALWPKFPTTRWSNKNLIRREKSTVLFMKSGFCCISFLCVTVAKCAWLSQRWTDSKVSQFHCGILFLTVIPLSLFSGFTTKPAWTQATMG